jgi:preprotein translocase subunit YajC
MNDLTSLLLVLVVWIAIQYFVLPRLGVPS